MDYDCRKVLKKKYYVILILKLFVLKLFGLLKIKLLYS